MRRRRAVHDYGSCFISGHDVKTRTVCVLLSPLLTRARFPQKRWATLWSTGVDPVRTEPSTRCSISRRQAWTQPVEGTMEESP